jgi:exosome complex component CSL4
MATEGAAGEIAVPGKVLGPASKYLAGPGTHVHNGNIVSSLLGKVSMAVAATKGPGPAKRLNRITMQAPEGLPIISVTRHDKKQEVLPDVNNIVLCRVIRLMPKQAIVAIQQVDSTVLQTEWQGVIRVQDVRATEKDKVKIYESFRPGDIVRAQVVSFNTCSCFRFCSLFFFFFFFWSTCFIMLACLVSPTIDLPWRPIQLLSFNSQQ